MGPSPAKVAFRVTHIGLWQPPCIEGTCYFRAKKETRKVPMFGGVYRCVCLLIFEIWYYTMPGSWFRSVSTRVIEERSVWSISDWVLLLLSCCSFDRRERLGQNPFGSCWSVSSWYQICRVFHGGSCWDLSAKFDLLWRFCCWRLFVKTPVLFASLCSFAIEDLLKFCYARIRC
jgi:hypothetical protein